jgi:CRP-like cAMP-binding protein
MSPSRSTVVCASDSCKVHQMTGEDFLAMVDASPEVASSLLDMCRKRLFKKAVKSSSLRLGRGLTDEDLLAAFHEADVDKTQHLNLDEVRVLMHKMDPDFPESEIVALLKHVDTDGDGKCSLEEFKQLFRQFDKGD